jgi:hypothetical protein
MGGKFCRNLIVYTSAHQAVALTKIDWFKHKFYHGGVR